MCNLPKLLSFAQIVFVRQKIWAHIYMQPPVVKYQAIRKEHLCKE